MLKELKETIKEEVIDRFVIKNTPELSQALKRMKKYSNNSEMKYNRIINILLNNTTNLLVINDDEFEKELNIFANSIKTIRDNTTLDLIESVKSIENTNIIEPEIQDADKVINDFKNIEPNIEQEVKQDIKPDSVKPHVIKQDVKKEEPKSEIKEQVKPISTPTSNHNAIVIDEDL